MIQRVWVASEDTSTAAPEVVAELARHVLRAVASLRPIDDVHPRHEAFARIDHLKFSPVHGFPREAMATGA